MDPATTQAVAKATEESAKAAGKVADIVHDTGGYLRRVFADLPEDLVGVSGGDWLHEVRIRNRDRWRRRTEILRERDRHEAIELSPNMAMALIAGAQEESREVMELWARLLANAMDPNLNSVRQSFIDAVKKMDPPDALVLGFIAESKLFAIWYGEGHKEPSSINLSHLADNLQRRVDEVHLSIEHLKILGLIDGGWVGDTYAEYRRTLMSREFV